MVNIKTASAQDRRGNESFAQLVQRGALLPIIAGEALEDLVLGSGAHERVLASYAKHVGYPLPDPQNLHKVAKYQSLTTGWKDWKLKSDYLDNYGSFVLDLARQAGGDAEQIDETLAQAADFTLSQFAAGLGYPRFDRGAEDPLLLLANLPLSIYLTTSPFTFIEEALRQAGKTPRTELCRWRPELNKEASVFDAVGPGGVAYAPRPNAPLVYHLFGVDAQPESLILTEDDHLDFLAAVSQGRGKDQGVDPVHDVIKGALQSSALLLLGFSLDTWAFRVLYRGLIKPMPPAATYERYCCVQLTPNELEKLYLEDYLRKDARFDRVYWETMDVFCRREFGV